MTAVRFFDALQGKVVSMNFDFGRAMRERHEAEILTATKPIADGTASCVTSSDMAVSDELFPDGLSESGGSYFADCCCCGRECNVTEFVGEEEIDFARWYGGCGPGCTP